MSRHSAACDCSTCSRHFRNYSLFAGSLFIGVFVLGLLSALDLLLTLFKGVSR